MEDGSISRYYTQGAGYSLGLRKPPKDWLPGAPEGLNPISSSTTSHCLSQGVPPSLTWKQFVGGIPLSCLPHQGTLPLKYLELTVQPLSPYPGELVAVLPLLLYSAGMLQWKLLFITDFQFTLQRQSPVVKACGKFSVRVHMKQKQQNFKEMPAKKQLTETNGTVT